jgi:hypothetical protein
VSVACGRFGTLSTLRDKHNVWYHCILGCEGMGPDSYVSEEFVATIFSTQVIRKTWNGYIERKDKEKVPLNRR